MPRPLLTLLTAITLVLILLHTALAAATPAGGLLKRSDDWFRGTEGRKTTECVLSWQSPAGSWPKNTDTTRAKFSGDRARIKGTFDNGATTDELRLLARAFHATGDKRCQSAVLQGLDHILDAQYANGGWPQSHPPGKGYHRHITFNDHSMVRLLELLREVTISNTFDFVAQERRSATRKAFAKGVDCILKCQVIVRGTPTVWCAQHDEATLAPAPARSYELRSLSGSESAGILRFLMSLDTPSPEVIRAVKDGVAWFESAKITGIRLVKTNGDRKVIPDASASPLWARFYEIDTNQPFFCGRDGVKKSTLAEIEAERRNGYAWYGNWGESVAREFAKWPHATKPAKPSGTL